MLGPPAVVQAVPVPYSPGWKGEVEGTPCPAGTPRAWPAGMSERETLLAQAGEGGPEINVGVLLAVSPRGDVDDLRDFARRLARDAAERLREVGTGRWSFHFEEPVRLDDDAVRRPSDFLDESSLRMVEGPYDVVVTLTNVGLMSRRHQLVAGLASEVAQLAVLSTRKLLITPRGQPVRTLDAESVRWNAATLLLHLLGHMMGLKHHREAGAVMSPFVFDAARRAAPAFDPHCVACLRRRVARLPEREQTGGGVLRGLAFHLASALRHPGQVLHPLWRNRAPLVPLSLPSLVTAAALPTFILIFTAEIWDAGLHMSPYVAWSFAAATVLVATWYLTVVQNLFFPRKEKRVLTEHMAVVNVSILLTMFLAMIGLLVMVMLLVLFVEYYIFPEQLIYSWPTLELKKIPVWQDRVQMAAFIGTIAVLTGGLAGGLESRTVIRHLALFRDDP